MTAPASGDAAVGLEEALNAESRRLEKLWDAYKAQERELAAALQRVDDLEAQIGARDETVARAEADARRVSEEKDAEITRLSGEVSRLEGQVADLEALKEEVKALEAYQGRVKELEDAYARERERLAKLYLVYEELEDEVKRLRGQAEGASDAASE